MKIRAILIDSRARTLKDVFIEQGNLQDIYELLRCHTFDVPFKFENGDALYVDDEGLMKNRVHHWFVPEEWGQPVAGNGLIVGTARNGDSADAKAKGVSLAFPTIEQMKIFIESQHRTLHDLAAKRTDIIAVSMKDTLDPDWWKPELVEEEK